jgi:hypothetical protein
MLLLKEELHIAEPVKILTNYIVNKIKIDWKDSNTIFISKEEYEQYLISNNYNINGDKIVKKYNYLFFDNDIKIVYSISNFNSVEVANNYVSGSCRIEYFDDGINIPKVNYYVLDVNLGLVNYDITPSTFNEVIQHELNHLYQKIYKLDNIKTVSQNTFNKWMPLYDKAINNINNANKYISDISYVYYYLNNGEQDAYINGLYGNIMNSKPNNIEEFVKTTRQYKTLNKLKEIEKSIYNWNENDEELIEAKNFFIKSDLSLKCFKSQLLSFIQSNLNRFQNKINGVIRKTKQELFMTTECYNKIINNYITLLSTSHQKLYL